MRKRNFRKSFKALLTLLIIYLVFIVLVPVINSPQTKLFIQNLGVWAPFALIVYFVVSHVLAPLTGSPGVFLAINLFGIYNAHFYLYLASLISATINFYISRKFGRKWVVRLVGKDSMEDVDKFVEAEGIEVLIISRIFGNPLFEFISYAAGLTQIEFKKYITITTLCPIIPTVVFMLAFRNTDFTSTSGILIWVGSGVVLVLVFTLFINRYLNKKKNNNAKMK